MNRVHKRQIVDRGFRGFSATITIILDYRNICEGVGVFTTSINGHMTSKLGSD